MSRRDLPCRVRVMYRWDWPCRVRVMSRWDLPCRVGVMSRWDLPCRASDGLRKAGFLLNTRCADVCLVHVQQVERERVERERERVHFRLLDDRHWAQESKSVSLSFTRGRERYTYTAATEVVSVASPLFSRDAARCCRAVAAPRVRPLGAQAREIQIF